MYRTTYSVARCCASAALPPLPQKKSVPWRLTVSCTSSSARSSSGPSSVATRSASAARSRSALANAEAAGEVFVTWNDSAVGKEELAQPAEDSTGRGERRHRYDRFARQHAPCIL